MLTYINEMKLFGSLKRIAYYSITNLHGASFVHQKSLVRVKKFLNVTMVLKVFTK